MPKYVNINGQLYPLVEIGEIGKEVKKTTKGGNTKRKSGFILSNEVKMWIFIAIMSFFAIIIVKNWITDATSPPERVEKRKK